MEEFDETVAELWRSMQPVALERAQRLRRACATTPDDPSVREDSHKLAGALGMYGLVEASALAIRIDGLVTDGALSDARRAAVLSDLDLLVAAVEAGR